MNPYLYRCTLLLWLLKTGCKLHDVHGRCIRKHAESSDMTAVLIFDNIKRTEGSWKLARTTWKIRDNVTADKRRQTLSNNDDAIKVILRLHYERSFPVKPRAEGSELQRRSARTGWKTLWGERLLPRPLYSDGPYSWGQQQSECVSVCESVCVRHPCDGHDASACRLFHFDRVFLTRPSDPRRLRRVTHMRIPQLTRRRTKGQRTICCYWGDGQI